MAIIHHFFDRKTQLNDIVFDVDTAHRVKQIHSNRVIEVNKPQDNWIEADGLITRGPNLPIGIITADCAPVLFEGVGVIGAAHAGWQGALSGVLDNMLGVIGGDPALVKAYIGPCITQQSYEVSKGFEEPFLDHAPVSERFFIGGASPDKLQFDLAGYCAFRLARAGVTTIKIDGRDTLTHDMFHSHRGGADNTQRNLSAIMIEEG